MQAVQPSDLSAASAQRVVQLLVKVFREHNFMCCKLEALHCTKWCWSNVTKRWWHVLSAQWPETCSVTLHITSMVTGQNVDNWTLSFVEISKVSASPFVSCFCVTWRIVDSTNEEVLLFVSSYLSLVICGWLIFETQWHGHWSWSVRWRIRWPENWCSNPSIIASWIAINNVLVHE